jgi:chromosomal replication initiation ATPase DnaA
MARQLRLSLEHRDPPGFDDFACGASNAEAAAAVQAWPAWRGGCLALIGPAGCGKSHLAQAWARAADALVLEAGVADIAVAEGRPVLVENADSAASAESLFHLINLAARPGGSLLLTSRTLPAAWSTDLPDLRSRLNALPVAEIGPPDDAVLEGVLRRFFRDHNIRPPEEVYPYLLARMNRSIPDAEEIVRRLNEAGDAVTRVLARQILDEGSQLDL